MIRVQMQAADLVRMRFAYSPLIELTESAYMINAGRINLIHRAWFASVRDGLRRIDMTLVRAVVPSSAYLASFLRMGAVDTMTTIEQQLQQVADCPVDVFRAELEKAWGKDPMPRPAQRLIAEGAAGPRQLADALMQYWTVAIEPYWPHIRTVLDGDVAYRAAQLARGGIHTMLPDLHHRLEFVDHALQMDTPVNNIDHDLQGTGLLLVPSVFAWPFLVFSVDTDPPGVIYGARGIGELWAATEITEAGDDALGELFGPRRAAILISVAAPKSTTELARELRQSPSAVSSHLAILRRNGLVTSRRDGRRVLYLRTPLATSVVSASSPELIAADGTA